MFIVRTGYICFSASACQMYDYHYYIVLFLLKHCCKSICKKEIMAVRESAAELYVGVVLCYIGVMYDDEVSRGHTFQLHLRNGYCPVCFFRNSPRGAV